MNYWRLLARVGPLPVFDLSTVVQMADERRETIKMQLHRWCKAGKLIALRRGMYAFPPVCGKAVNPAATANALYAPSYLTAQWAMSFLGLIPEKTVVYTSVTTRKPALFANPLGTFRYRHLTRRAFFGYRSIEIAGARGMLAEPEKALLDFWHFERGPWTSDRMAEMRFQNTEMIDPTRLRAHARRFDSPRLVKAVDVWLGILDRETEGTREL